METAGRDPSDDGDQDQEKRVNTALNNPAVCRCPADPYVPPNWRALGSIVTEIVFTIEVKR